MGREVLAAAGRDVAAVSRLFWVDSAPAVRREALLRLAGVVAMMLVRSNAALRLSRTRAAQLDALAGGGAGGRVVTAALRFVLASSLLTPLGLVYDRLWRGLRHQWVTHLTEHFLSSFVDAQCLRLGGGAASAEGEDAQPDARVSYDIDKFVRLVMRLALDALQGIIHLATFGGELWGISPRLAAAAAVGAVVATVLTLRVGSGLDALFQEEQQRVGAFSYALTRMRENAESIAFYGGQADEVSEASGRLAARQEAEWRRLGLRDVVETASRSWRRVYSALPILVLSRAARAGRAHPGAHGPAAHGHSHAAHGHSHGGDGHSHGAADVRPAAASVGVVSRASEAFNEILMHLSMVADSWTEFARLAAHARQLRAQHENVLALRSLRAGRAEGATIAVEPAPPQPAWLRVAGLTLALPNGRVLIRDLTFDAPAEGGILVAGPSGVGKTTLLRAVAGLWRSGSGRVARPPAEQMMFLPQKPYMALGTLRRQLLYPHCSGAGDAALSEAMRRVGLGAVLERVGSLDAERRWTEELSAGEQQRVAFARVLVHRPLYVLMDESTSACDAATEEQLYGLVSASCRAWLSVGHRQSIRRFHSVLLELRGGGDWALGDTPR